MSETELSRVTHDRLRAELEDLTTRGRVEIAAAIDRIGAALAAGMPPASDVSAAVEDYSASLTAVERRP